jgi:hypothetical protein
MICFAQSRTSAEMHVYHKDSCERRPLLFCLCLKNPVTSDLDHSGQRLNCLHSVNSYQLGRESTQCLLEFLWFIGTFRFTERQYLGEDGQAQQELFYSNDEYNETAASF